MIQTSAKSDSVVQPRQKLIAKCSDTPKQTKKTTQFWYCIVQTPMIERPTKMQRVGQGGHLQVWSLMRVELQESFRKRSSDIHT